MCTDMTDIYCKLWRILREWESISLSLSGVELHSSSRWYFTWVLKITGPWFHPELCFSLRSPSDEGWNISNHVWDRRSSLTNHHLKCWAEFSARACSKKIKHKATDRQSLFRDLVNWGRWEGNEKYTLSPSRCCFNERLGVEGASATFPKVAFNWATSGTAAQTGCSRRRSSRQQ